MTICQQHENGSVTFQPSVRVNRTAVPVRLRVVVGLHGVLPSPSVCLTSQEVPLQPICDNRTLCGILQEVSWKGHNTQGSGNEGKKCDMSLF